ncbi:hypothetical protein Lepto7375DRAFT_5653 [Leptolyngbya sp. PCC 7375]|nr:hypothetical protein Lepto7375DRAFT_5653 [Leptolyngbya sp. PCC 7375]
MLRPQQLPPSALKLSEISFGSDLYFYIPGETTAIMAGDAPLKLHIIGRPREWNHIANVRHTRHKLHQSLKS